MSYGWKPIFSKPQVDNMSLTELCDAIQKVAPCKHSPAQLASMMDHICRKGVGVTHDRTMPQAVSESLVMKSLKRVIWPEQTANEAEHTDEMRRIEKLKTHNFTYGPWAKAEYLGARDLLLSPNVFSTNLVRSQL